MTWLARLITLLCLGLILAYYGVTLYKVVFFATLFGIAEVESRRIRRRYL